MDNERVKQQSRTRAQVIRDMQLRRLRARRRRRNQIIKRVAAVAIAAITAIAIFIVSLAADKPEEPVQETASLPVQQAIPEPIETETVQQPLIVETEDGYITREALEAYTEEIGALYNISPELLQAIAERESSLKISAENGSCKGLMQVSTRWHTDRMEKLGVDDIYEPYGNILVAADFIAELRDTTANGQDVYYVLMRYNLEIKTADNYYSQGIITSYAQGIVERAEQLERIHEGAN